MSSVSEPAGPVVTVESSPPTSNDGDEPATYSVSIKVLRSTNKKDFTVYTLRSISAEHFVSPDTLREEIFCQLGETVVSSKRDFHMGYFSRNVKLWINNKQDSKDACKTLTMAGKLTLWCIGIPPEKSGHKRGRSSTDTAESGSDDDDACTSRKKRCGRSEERRARVKELKCKLQQQHGSDYSAVQYSLWAEMLVGETHDSLDSPPDVPMFGMKRVRGRASTSTSDLNAALTGMADRIVTALSPRAAPLPTSSYTNSNSPSKNVELRSKYMQQLRELVNLREIGALTSEEYEDQRLTLVDLMKKLNVPCT